MAESLPHRGATLWGSSHCHCSREAQPTERFYKSVRPRSQVRRYKTLYQWWLRSTIHRKNRPCRSFEDPQEVESETGAHTSSRRETPSSSSSSSSSLPGNSLYVIRNSPVFCLRVCCLLNECDDDNDNVYSGKDNTLLRTCRVAPPVDCCTNCEASTSLSDFIDVIPSPTVSTTI